jgi:hypothetical protein
VSRVVHFSHHTCGSPPSWWIAERQLYLTFETTYPNEPAPRAFGCNQADRWSRKKPGATSKPILTSHDWSRVTCKRCQKARVAITASAPGRRAVPYRELVQRAWLHCCSHKGAPNPLTGDEAKALLLETAVDTVKEAVSMPDLFVFRRGQDEDRAAIIEKLDKFAGGLVPEVLELVRPILNEWQLALEFLTGIDECRQRAERARDAAIEQVKRWHAEKYRAPMKEAA